MSPLRMYLAASWSRKHEIKHVADRLRDAGCVITSTWFDEPDGPHDSEGNYGDDLLEEIAARNIREMDNIDALVLFAGNPRVPQIGGGRHFEFGYCYGLGNRVIIVGPAEHVFWHLPGVLHCETTDELIQKTRTFHDTIGMGEAA